MCFAMLFILSLLHDIHKGERCQELLIVPGHLTTFETCLSSDCMVAGLRTLNKS